MGDADALSRPSLAALHVGGLETPLAFGRTGGNVGITETIAAWGTQVIDATGYAGLFFLMVLESMIPPIPSEAIMPFAGFLAAEGSMSAALAIGVATLGSFAGALAFYALGRFGGRPFVERYGRIVRIDAGALSKAEAYFLRHGAVTVLVGRFVPIVRPLIAIPAGIGKMGLASFSFYTLLGAGAWNAFLAGSGILLRRNWETVLRYSKWVDIAVLGALVALVAFFVVKRLRRRQT